jgi:hypothetical protein
MPSADDGGFSTMELEQPGLVAMTACREDRGSTCITLRKEKDA